MYSSHVATTSPHSSYRVYSTYLAFQLRKMRKKKFSAIRPTLQATFQSCMDSWAGHQDILTRPDRFKPPEAPAYTLNNYQLSLAIAKLTPAEVRPSASSVWAACWNMKYTKYMELAAASVCKGEQISVLALCRRMTSSAPLQSAFYFVMGKQGCNKYIRYVDLLVNSGRRTNKYGIYT